MKRYSLTLVFENDSSLHTEWSLPMKDDDARGDMDKIRKAFDLSLSNMTMFTMRNVVKGENVLPEAFVAPWMVKYFYFRMEDPDKLPF